MKITKWVDMGQEVEVEICAKDISAALSEVFEGVTQDHLGEPVSKYDVIRALSNIGTFLAAFSDDQIRLLSEAQRRLVGDFLTRQADRFKISAVDTHDFVTGEPI